MKVSLYKEWFYKVYIFQTEKAYAKVDTVSERSFWYDSGITAKIAFNYMELVKQRECLKNAVTNAERMKVNKSIKTAIACLDSEELW